MSDNFTASDEDDRLLFDSYHDRKFANRVIRIKHNHHAITSLDAYASAPDALNEGAWKRLGFLLGRNTRVKSLRVPLCKALLDGLRDNQHIEKLTCTSFGSDLRVLGTMSDLAPLLNNNPVLQEIDLYSCNLGPIGLGILSNALLNSSGHVIEKLGLGRNNFGDIDLGELVSVLIRNRNLRRLYLDYNGIGLRGCTSLASLLRNEKPRLEKISLRGDGPHGSGPCIKNDMVIMLADSLNRNTKLRRLDIGNGDSYDGINKAGWSAILKLVCNRSSTKHVIDSNHTLDDVGQKNPTHHRRNMVMMTRSSVNALGGDDGSLLVALLKLNGSSLDRNVVIRRKILWSHTQGDINIGHSSVPTGAMPCILAWIGGDSKAGDDANDNDHLIHHRNLGNSPRVQSVAKNSFRRDAFYRILRARPTILHNR